MKCRHCGNEFIQKRKKSVCCSQTCRMRLVHGWPCYTEISNNKKYCSSCKQILDITMFYKVKHGVKFGTKRLRSWCITCNKKYVNRSTRNYKKEIVDFMGGKCCKCGYDKCIHALDIHHLDPLQKDPKFKQLRNILSDDLKKELEKCILVCANCHREIHTMNTIT